MDGLLSFGTIIRWNDSHYVFLAEIGQIAYLARILEDENLKSSLLHRYSQLEKASLQGKFNAQTRLNTAIYSFVTLTTKEFEGHIALLYPLGNNSTEMESVLNRSKLNDEDLKKLKRTIIDDQGIPRELREFVGELN